jgi:hypothetical protein
MKKYIIGAVTFLFLFVAANSTYTEVQAATKKSSCSCSRTAKRKVSRAKRTNFAVKGANYSNQNYQSAGVVGPAYATYTLPANEYIRLRMNSTISSATSRPGDRFTATVITPVYANGVEVVPAGATVHGRVASLTAARTRGRSGQIALAFDTLVLPDGTKKNLKGDLADIQDEKGGNVDKESGVSGRTSDKRNVEYVGGGGIGGAIIGGIIGGGKGAAIGGAIGAGAGVAGVMLQKGNEAVIKGGTEMGMITSVPIEFRVRADRDR